MDEALLLQAYRARLPKRASDAEFIDDDIYASDMDLPEEVEPVGLVDRLYKEQLSAKPMRFRDEMYTVPTTKNRF